MDAVNEEELGVMEHFTDVNRWFPAALLQVLGIEGGFSDDARDRGGATRFGISLAFARDLAAREPKWLALLDVDGDGKVSAKDVRQIRPEVARAIYAAEFWIQHRCGELPHPAGGMFFSYVVNMRAETAGRVLQEAINRTLSGREDAPLVRDGIVGPKTVEAARQCAGRVDELCKRLDAAASAQYAQFEQAEVFGDGWQYRSADALWWAALQWESVKERVREREGA